MIVIPFSSDQPVNADCVERLGVGKRLEYKNANSQTIREYAHSILDDHNMKNNILKVKEYINKALGNKGGAEYIIKFYEEYIKEV